MMDDISVDTNQEMMLDANSVSGLLWDIFGAEMTAEPTKCAHCGNQAEIGTLLAYYPGTGSDLAMLNLWESGLEDSPDPGCSLSGCTRSCIFTVQAVDISEKKTQPLTIPQGCVF